ncbi:NifB/NifX family molybdenum-iron cluster-binding protein [Paludicola sp. MB14-C6]|uniref:NifB/NifX family molybdenum-iron cluster-binding protein n=1 Tax=Paludihabitans sp. MB14-C6 TaxID=3070656 RepID=UPI0027DC726C|nr:NifB/NifX family molybdenum-iron cluster-binding protein [Paludicola sp. MB14-C6]WMJ23781.1 NifB/NifX family molybdenum-iron cluster-binding protein [Paludicola sp. MB14-C6]
MKIAVTYENNQVFQHFGHSEQFKFYNIENNQIVSTEVVPTNGSGHGALAGFLKANGVNVLICGGIGGGAKTALAEAGIQLFGGVNGSADLAVAQYLNGTLVFNPNTQCNHHHEGEQGHTCGDHGCGSHTCGSH